MKQLLTLCQIFIFFTMLLLWLIILAGTVSGNMHGVNYFVLGGVTIISMGGIVVLQIGKS